MGAKLLSLMETQSGYGDPKVLRVLCYDFSPGKGTSRFRANQEAVGAVWPDPSLSLDVAHCGKVTSSNGMSLESVLDAAADNGGRIPYGAVVVIGDGPSADAALSTLNDGVLLELLDASRIVYVNPNGDLSNHEELAEVRRVQISSGNGHLNPDDALLLANTLVEIGQEVYPRD